MKILLFVEGDTEFKALPKFINKIIESKLGRTIEIEPVNFKGKNNLIKEASKKAATHLGLDLANEISAIVSLLDLYEAFDFSGMTTIDQKFTHAKSKMETAVGNPKFVQFFAVHETEAWLLSDPKIFPATIKSEITEKSPKPEEVNFDLPPSKLLDKLYREKLSPKGRIEKYKKTLYGTDLFSRLDPEVVYQKCPYFKEMIDYIVHIAV